MSKLTINALKDITPKLIEDLGMQYPKEASKRKARYAMYECRCGKKFKSRTDHVKNGSTQSCGCHLKKRLKETHTKHGMYGHEIYAVWRDMIGRCNNSKNSWYKYYGGRGITVCERWKDVKLFIEDMYSTYEEGLTIDRINHNGNYEPSNCRWTTGNIQARNTRRISKNNTSGYRGVSFEKSKGKYVAYIRVNTTRIHLGTFPTALEAGIAYDTYVRDNYLEHTTNDLLTKGEV